MTVGESVKKAIDDWKLGEFDPAMIHACFAVDGTAKKVYPHIKGSNARFTRLLRDNYDILGPMGAPGINLVDTRFPVKVKRPKAAGGQPDIADIIYGIHRCTHGHGDELPNGFELISNVAGPQGFTETIIKKGTIKPSEGSIQLSDRMIFGLLAVAVLSPANEDQKVPDGYHLTFGRKPLTLPINEWWGRAKDFPKIAATEPMPLVKLDFKEWK